MSNLGAFVKRFRDITRTDAGINGDAQRIEQLTWMLFLNVYDAMEDVWEISEDSYQSIIPEECRWRNWADTNNEKGLKGDELLGFVNNKLFPTLQKLEIPYGCPRKKSLVRDVFADIHNYMKDGVALRQCLELINECDFNDPEQSHAFGTIYESILKELQNAGSSGEFYTPRALTDFIAAHVDLKIGDKVADFACGTGGFLNSARKLLKVQVGEDSEKLSILNHSFFGIEKKPLPYLLCATNLLLNGIDEPNIVHGNSLTKNVDEYSEKDQFDVILMNPPYGGKEKAEILQNFPADRRSSETADLFIILIMARLKETGRAAVIIPDGFLFGDGNKAKIKQYMLEHCNLHTIVRLPPSVFAPYTSIATNILFFNGDGPTEKTWVYRLDMPEGYKNFSKTKPMLLEHLAPLESWWKNRKEIVVDGFPKAKLFQKKGLVDSGCNFDLCGFPQTEEEILPPDELIAKYKEERARLEKAIDESLAKIMALLEKK
jgi:type I restriction enzyme M protein